MPLFKKKTVIEEINDALLAVFTAGERAAKPEFYFYKNAKVTAALVRAIEAHQEGAKKKDTIVIPYQGEKPSWEYYRAGGGPWWESPSLKGAKEVPLKEALQLIVNYLDLALTREEKIPEKLVKNRKRRTTDGSN